MCPRPPVFELLSTTTLPIKLPERQATTMRISVVILSAIVSASVASPMLESRRSLDCTVTEDCEEGYSCEFQTGDTTGSKSIRWKSP
jgi:hypothetical protein